jgi:hypothetical protein
MNNYSFDGLLDIMKSQRYNLNTRDFLKLADINFNSASIRSIGKGISIIKDIFKEKDNSEKINMLFNEQYSSTQVDVLVYGMTVYKMDVDDLEIASDPTIPDITMQQMIVAIKNGVEKDIVKKYKDIEYGVIKFLNFMFNFHKDELNQLFYNIANDDRYQKQILEKMNKLKELK